MITQDKLTEAAKQINRLVSGRFPHDMQVETEDIEFICHYFDKIGSVAAADRIQAGINEQLVLQAAKNAAAAIRDGLESNGVAKADIPDAKKIVCILLNNFYGPHMEGMYRRAEEDAENPL